LVFFGVYSALTMVPRWHTLAYSGSLSVPTHEVAF